MVDLREVEPVQTAVLVIEPTRGWVDLKLGELWAYRELLYFLAWREVKVRYKQTAIGVAWAVLQPLFTTLVFSLFFGRLAKVPSDGIPYPVFSLAALVPWNFFVNGLAQSANSLVGTRVGLRFSCAFLAPRKSSRLMRVVTNLALSSTT